MPRAASGTKWWTTSLTNNIYHTLSYIVESYVYIHIFVCMCVIFFNNNKLHHVWQFHVLSTSELHGISRCHITELLVMSSPTCLGAGRDTHGWEALCSLPWIMDHSRVPGGLAQLDLYFGMAQNLSLPCIAMNKHPFTSLFGVQYLVAPGVWLCLTRSHMVKAPIFLVAEGQEPYSHNQGTPKQSRGTTVEACNY